MPQIEFNDIFHPRNRVGRFVNTPDMNPRMTLRRPSLRNPGVPPTHFTEAEIAAAGLDKWPTPGPKAKELLGDLKTTAEKYGPDEPAGGVGEGPKAGDEPLDGGEHYLAGFCTDLAVAFQRRDGNLKLRATYDGDPDQGATLEHVVAYDPETGVAYDARGEHKSVSAALKGFNGKVEREETADSILMQDGADERLTKADAWISRFWKRSDRFPEYGSDRKAAWLSLINDEIKDKVAPTDEAGKQIQPTALFMAGGTATGKTTILRENRELLAPPEETTVHIDVDKIKEQMAAHGMPEYKAMRDAGDRWAASAVHQESGDIAALMEKMAVDKGLNVIIDGTGNSDPGLFRADLERIRNANYKVDVLYVNRPVPESISLAIWRAEKDGRFVPLEKIREIHKLTSKNFRDEISKLGWLDSLIVYDQDGPIASQKPDGKMEPLEEGRYADFVKKADAKIDKKKLDALHESDPLAGPLAGHLTVTRNFGGEGTQKGIFNVHSDGHAISPVDWEGGDRPNSPHGQPIPDVTEILTPEEIANLKIHEAGFTPIPPSEWTVDRPPEYQPHRKGPLKVWQPQS